MSTDKANNTPKPRLILDEPVLSHSSGIMISAAEQRARIQRHVELLDMLEQGLLKTGLVFTCQVAGLADDTFQVTQFDLNEGLSELFTLTIQVVSTQSDIDFSYYLGGASSLTVRRNGKKIRTVQGLLSSAEQSNTDGIKTWYQLEIRPEMWVMTLNQDSRIFQHKTVPEILKQLLDEAHIKYDNRLYQPELHQPRHYVTQKRESAYDFWCRLAFEEGINFWFEEGPKLFYSDNHLGMTAGITLTYNPQSETDITDSTATKWRYTERLCSDVRIDKDYNQIRPSYPLSQQTTGKNHQQHPIFESYGRFQEDAQGQPFNQLRYEQSQNHRQTGYAQTNCFALMPGKIFTLTNHPCTRMNECWQIISVTHHGVQPLGDNSEGQGTQLSNHVTFIPSMQEWRPPFHYKPLADGDELATVVGPDGEEIYTNEQGAVKVYFHWDRRGTPDHSGSCWLRVAQGWSGNGFGFIAIPRVGQEVIVSYLNGDIDRPIITGCTYNGRNTPPLDLPKEKTKTTFRSKTHKGTGFNELRFEDAGGREEVYLHAQNDLNIHVQHDSHWHTEHDVRQRIDNQRVTEIAGDEHFILKGTQKSLIEGNVSLQIKGAKHCKVNDALIAESGKETHFKSGGKIILEAVSEITLKVGSSFIRLTPNAIFTSGNLDIGSSGPGIGQDPNIQLPDGVTPFEQPLFAIKKYCVLTANEAGSLLIKPAKDEN